MPSGTVTNNRLGKYALSNSSVSCVTNYIVRTGRSGNAGNIHRLARNVIVPPPNLSYRRFQWISQGGYQAKEHDGNDCNDCTLGRCVDAEE
jgi:hypothetical protein